MSAVEEYRRATRIADEILSEAYATTLQVASTSREMADAAIAELEATVERLKERGDVLADIVERQAVCGQCGRTFQSNACGFSHATVQGLLNGANP